MRGLKRQDFEIVEDGVKQSIASMASEDAPLDLVLAIDVSGSMERALEQVKAAVKQLLSKLRPGDAATLVGFNDTMFLAAEREKDQAARERAVDLLTAWGGTALYDATVRAIDLVSREWGRKGIVIFSDGDDRNSLTSREAATARVQASDAMLYTIGFGGGATVPSLKTKLEQYAKATGGRAFFPQRAQDLDAVFDQIVAELANQYVLSYSSTNLKQDNGWRSIKVRVRSRQIRHQGSRRISGIRATANGEVIMMTAKTRLFVLAATAATLFTGGATVALGATGRRGPDALVPERRRSGNGRRRRRRRQGRPLRGLAPGDFVVTVGGQPTPCGHGGVHRSIGAARAAAPARTENARISTNEGGGVGRLFAFIVDQNTLDLGSARRVASAAGPFFSRLTFADRSALMLMPLGPNVPFTWAHDRVRAGLQRATGVGRMMAGWEFGSLADARDIANHNQIALRTVGDRECGTASASGFGAGPTTQSPGVASPPAGPDDAAGRRHANRWGGDEWDRHAGATGGRPGTRRWRQLGQLSRRLGSRRLASG